MKRCPKCREPDALGFCPKCHTSDILRRYYADILGRPLERVVRADETGT